MKLREEISKLKDARVPEILKFHDEYLDLIMNSKGSSANHQNWQGGYADHVTQCFLIADNIFPTLSKVGQLDFELSSAKIVLFFHDIEKIWKYTQNITIDKEEWYDKVLPSRGIVFTSEERHALKYIHGEGDDYSSEKRVMSPLAAFCHIVDTASARIFYDLAKPL